jgi:lipoprotein-anchoring transpeptidase ErfK/SrfK
MRLRHGLFLAVALMAVPAHADMWIEAGEVPMPDWAKSVEIIRDDEALSVTPGGTRRGLIAAGVKLPLLGATRGPGCLSRWLLVGPLAYVCSDKVKLSADPPGVLESIHPAPADAMPYRYYFVGKDGADAFAKLSDADDETPAEQLERGWTVAGVGEIAHKGATYVITRKGRYIPRAQLGAIAPYAFHGETIANGELSFGWILPDKTTVLNDAKPNAKSVGARTRLQKIDVRETKVVGKDTFLRIGDAEWIRGKDARVPTIAAPPEEAGPRWIDIELSTQTLVAYEGKTPVFATVVSTGRVPGSTPKGVHKVWVKLRSSTMSNADDATETNDDTTPYSIEDVPWVQYFSNGVAIHGAFWHRKFGNVASHGCVNVAPLDAMRLFDWTLPRLPRGWDAVFPTAAEPPTVIRVR